MAKGFFPGPDKQMLGGQQKRRLYALLALPGQSRACKSCPYPWYSVVRTKYFTEDSCVRKQAGGLRH